MSASTTRTTDVVYSILGVGEDSPIAALRNDRPNQIDELQAYYLSLFAPEAASAEAFPLKKRYLVAIRVASHTGSTDIVAWYEHLAREAGVSDEKIAATKDIATPATDDSVLGAAIRHADLLTTHPVDAEASNLQALKDAGLTPAGILSLSQVIAFVSYQLRFIAGLRAFGGQA